MVITLGKPHMQHAFRIAISVSFTSGILGRKNLKLKRLKLTHADSPTNLQTWPLPRSESESKSNQDTNEPLDVGLAMRNANMRVN